MATQLFVRAKSGTQEIADLGITITTDWYLLSSSAPSDPEGNSGQFSAREIRDSKDLWDLITDDTIEWSKYPPTVEAAGDYLGDYMLFQDFTDDWFDVTSGRFTFPNSPTLPVTGVEGDAYWDSDDDELYIWDGDEWIRIGQTVDHGELEGLGDDDHAQYALLAGDLIRNIFTGGADFSTASGLILPTGTDRTGLATQEGNMMWDTDDDEPWWYDGTQWVTLTSLVSGIVDHGDLNGLEDDDHPQYTDWDHDETISGVWTFDTDTNEPAFVITPDTSAPTTKLTDGAVAIIDGLLSVYDSTRGKWLSTDRQKFVTGRHGRATNIYLRGPDGVPTSQTGFRMARNGTIVALWAQSEADGNDWTFEIRDSTGSVIASLAITTDGNQVTTTNVDVSQGDEIRTYCNGQTINDPLAGFEVAWRE